jgi:hypothetical protein
LQRHRGCIDTAPPQTLQRQDWVSAVKVGKNTNGNVEAYEPGESAKYSEFVATLLKSE